MIIEVDGQRFDVPDDATPEEMDALTRPAPAGPKASESAARGGLQGLSLGFGDEGAAAIAAALPFTDREAVGQGKTLGERFRSAREFYRSRNKAAEEAHPALYTGGQIAGAVAPLLASGGLGAAAKAPSAGKLLMGAAGQGAIQGAGYSEHGGARLVGDTALGAGLGVAGFGAGRALAGAAKGAVRGARSLLGSAERRAAGQASEEVAQALNSLRGAYGGARQNESRAIEVLLRAESTGALTPEQAAQLSALKASPEWTATVQNVAKNYMEDFPGLASTAESARGAYQQAAGQTEADAAKRAAALLSGKEARSQIGARLKRYGPPALGTLIGGSIGGPLGVGIGALAGAGTRPMVHALRRMVQHPSVQASLARGVQSSAQSVANASPTLARGATAPAIAALSASMHGQDKNATASDVEAGPIGYLRNALRETAEGMAGVPNGPYGEMMNRIMAGGRSVLPGGESYGEEMDRVRAARERVYPGIYSVIPEVSRESKAQALSDYTSGMAPGMVGAVKPVVPRVLYHGTNAVFDSFQSRGDLGIHFTPDRALAQNLAKIRAAEAVRNAGAGRYNGEVHAAGVPRVVAAEVNIRNPLRIKDMGDWIASDVADQLVKDGVLTAEEGDLFIGSYARGPAANARLTSLLKSKGYDGLVYRNEFEGGGDSYAAFDPSQAVVRRANLKHANATGTNTEKP